MTEAQVHTESGGPLDKGLKAGALGLISSIVVGMASTAPAYSLAASLGAEVTLIELLPMNICVDEPPWVAEANSLAVASAPSRTRVDVGRWWSRAICERTWGMAVAARPARGPPRYRSEEHTSELHHT